MGKAKIVRDWHRGEGGSASVLRLKSENATTYVSTAFYTPVASSKKPKREAALEVATCAKGLGRCGVGWRAYVARQWRAVDLEMVETGGNLESCYGFVTCV
jgi:hypothetical protein